MHNDYIIKWGKLKISDREIYFWLSQSFGVSGKDLITAGYKYLIDLLWRVHIVNQHSKLNGGCSDGSFYLSSKYLWSD